MATGTCSRVVIAIASFGDDGVFIAPDDYNKFETLIGNYFNNSEWRGNGTWYTS